MININKGERMKDKFNLVLLGILDIFAFILFFGFVLSNIDPTQAKWEINSSSISTVNNTSNKYTVESSDIKP